MAEEARGVKGTLLLKEIGLTLRLGLYDFERIETRRVPVDITREGLLMKNGVPVVDYSELTSMLESSLKKEYLYIEELACHILELLDERWPGGWKVTVHKIQPPVNPKMTCASVTVESR